MKKHNYSRGGFLPPFKRMSIAVILLIFNILQAHSSSLNALEMTTSEGSLPEVVQQQQRVTGVVTDASTGETLVGVNIIVKGATVGTITGANGSYTLDVPDASGTLQFSFIGYIAQEISLGGRTNINVALESDVALLDEVVVVGYGVQKKLSVTSAVSSVSTEKLTERTVSNIQQSLQGQLPGLTVIDLGAAPGKTNYTIRVRGITTLSNNDPLVIVDGIEQSLNDINPNDIETVTLLKDASSTAIYGSRAANGVILINTKRGKTGKLSVSYSGYYALQKSNNNPTHMETRDYMELQNIAWMNSSGYEIYTQAYIDEYVAGTKTDLIKYPLPNTWFQTVLHTAPQVSHTFSASGGNETVKALFSTRIQDQDGIIPNSSNKIREIRLNTDFKFSKKLSMSVDMNVRNRNRISPTLESTVFTRMLQLSQFTVPKYPDGTYGISSDGHNPLMYAEIGGAAHLREDYLTGSVKGDWDIMKGLKFSVQLGAVMTSSYQKNFNNKYEVRDYYNKDIIKKSQPLNNLTEVRDFLREFTMNNLLTYTNTFGIHSISVLAGYSRIQSTTNNLSAYRQSFYNNEIQSLSQGANDATKNNSGNDSEWGLISYFGRINYAIMDRYLFEANARYDGSSRFIGDNRYSFFPSFSTGWRISEEDFWGNLNNTVNEFKLRASIGQTGNQAVALYSYVPTLNSVTYDFNNVAVSGLLQTAMANPNLTWETTTQTDIGLDAQILKNRFFLTIDYYFKKTEDILLVLPVPGTLGLDASAQNAGRVDNKGWELMLGTQNSFGQFGFEGNIALTINDNKVVDLAGTGPYTTTGQETRFTTQEGLPIRAYWGYLTDGYFQTPEEVASYPNIRSQIQPGDVKFLDNNNDGKITPADMVYLGRSFPKYNFSSSLGFTYKNFGLNMFWQGVAGVYARIGGAIEEMGIWGSFTSKYVTDNYWTPENRNSLLPRPLKFDNRNINFADRDRTNGAYLRLKNIQLSYNIPSSLSKKIFIEKMNVYVATTNLLTFASLNKLEVDPESVGRTQAYPQISVTTCGININF